MSYHGEFIEPFFPKLSIESKDEIQTNQTEEIKIVRKIFNTYYIIKYHINFLQICFLQYLYISILMLFNYSDIHLKRDNDYYEI